MGIMVDQRGTTEAAVAHRLADSWKLWPRHRGCLCNPTDPFSTSSWHPQPSTAVVVGRQVRRSGSFCSGGGDAGCDKPSACGGELMSSGCHICGGRPGPQIKLVCDMLKGHFGTGRWQLIMVGWATWRERLLRHRRLACCGGDPWPGGERRRPWAWHMTHRIIRAGGIPGVVKFIPAMAQSSMGWTSDDTPQVMSRLLCTCVAEQVLPCMRAG